MAIPRSESGLGVRPQLSDEVAARIRELIMAGQVRPGEFLRLERLAAQFGISVTPVREALQSLRSEGFVVLEPRRGFVVADLSQQDVRDLFWVQAVIAAELTSRAAFKLPAPALRGLEEVQRRMERAVAEGHIDQVEELNHAFHRAINLAAESAKLAWTLGAVSRYVPRGLYGRIPEWPGSCVGEHQRILEALRRGNRHAASGAMRMHITVAGELLLKHLERQGLWEPTPRKGPRAR